MSRRLFHAVTCTPERCDPPRLVDVERRGVVEFVEVPGCPIGDPRVAGAVLRLPVEDVAPGTRVVVDGEDVTDQAVAWVHDDDRSRRVTLHYPAVADG